MERERDIAVTLERTSRALLQRLHERHFEPGNAEAGELVDAVISALLRERHDVRLLRAALGYGAAGFRQRRPLCLLAARVDTIERTVLDGLATGPHAGDGAAWPELWRRSLPVLHAARQGIIAGFVTAGERARVRFARQVRHDLKNSVGTIGNALALLSDQEPRPEAGDARVHEIARKTLGLLDKQIRSGLSDDRILDEGLEPVSAPLAAITEDACRAVSEWRPERPVAIERADLPPVSVDAAVAQVLIESILLACAAGMPRATDADCLQVRVDEGAPAGKVALRIVTRPCEPDDALLAEWECVKEIARYAGCTLVGSPLDEGGVRVELPLLRRRQPSDDLRGGDQRDHL